MTLMIMVISCVAPAGAVAADDGYGLETFVRRLVAGENSSGQSVFVSEGEPPRAVTLESFPGVEFVEIWATEEIVTLPVGRSEPTIAMASFVPPAGGSRFRFVRIPPDVETFGAIAAGLDPEEARGEYLQKVPGLAETHEVDDLAMHRTNTVDYIIVMEGSIDLELDAGKTMNLIAGDVAVLNGNRHGWRNRGEEDCVLAVVMVGAEGAAVVEEETAPDDKAPPARLSTGQGKGRLSPTLRAPSETEAPSKSE